MLHTKEYLEQKYEEKDPWNYQETPEDLLRRDKIVLWLQDYCLHGTEPQGLFSKALDIGAGEGWITQFLPAWHIYGLEISDQAAARFPKAVKRITPGTLRRALWRFDLVTATGVFYEHYQWQYMKMLTEMVATNIVLTCHIEEHEIVPLPIEKQIHCERFPYRGGKTQIMRVFKLETAS